MTQLSFAAHEFVKKSKQTRRETFLGEMEAVVPWEGLLSVIAPSTTPRREMDAGPMNCRRCCAFTSCSNGLAIYSDAGMEEALHYIPLLRGFAGLDAGLERSCLMRRLFSISDTCWSGTDYRSAYLPR